MTTKPQTQPDIFAQTFAMRAENNLLAKLMERIKKDASWLNARLDNTKIEAEDQKDRELTLTVLLKKANAAGWTVWRGFVIEEEAVDPANHSLILRAGDSQEVLACCETVDEMLRQLAERIEGCLPITHPHAVAEKLEARHG